MSEHPSGSGGTELGIDAYRGDVVSAVDLLKNLEGQRVRGFAEGTEEHAGTALMSVELPTGEGVGVPVSMERDTSNISVYPDVHEKPRGEGLTAAEAEILPLAELEAECPDCRIGEAAHSDIMDPDEARGFFTIEVDSSDAPFAVEFHLDEAGRVPFYEVEL